jgi:hypothetical protein
MRNPPLARPGRILIIVKSACAIISVNTPQVRPGRLVAVIDLRN